MEDIILLVENLNKTYGSKQVLKNVSLEVRKNEILGFIGPNGAGKSTTMKCICNLIYPDSGKIEICGYDINKDREKALKLQSSLIEAPGLYQEMTGRDNIKLIAKIRKVSKDRVEEVYEFTELGDNLDKYVSSYSMGMKQRLALGIAILSKPKLLILDEPSSGLDPTGIIHLRNTLKKLVEEEDMSILFSSHQLGEIEALADRILCINKGEIIPTPIELYEQTNYIFDLEDINRGIEILKKNLTSDIFEIISDKSVKFKVSDQYDLFDIMSIFVNENLRVVNIYRDKIDVETVYRSVYGNWYRII